MVLGIGARFTIEFPMPSILRRETYSDVNFLWEVDAPDVAHAAQPGHS